MTRRLSQAISEGDGISVIVQVDGIDAARAAEGQGAEGLAVAERVDGLADATTLPVLWRAAGSPDDAERAGADAWLLVVERVDEDAERLEELHAAVLERGLEAVVEVRDEEELALALERLDPEIFLLSCPPTDDHEDELDRVLALLPDVPAGKLAIASVRFASREEVLALERAGMDAVLVAGGDVAELVGDAPASG